MIHRYVYIHIARCPSDYLSSTPKSTLRVLLLPRPVTSRGGTWLATSSVNFMSSRISELSMKQNSRPLRLFSDVHTCDDAVCAVAQRVRGQWIAVWIRQDRRAAGALHRCTAIYVYMLHGCMSVSFMQRWGTICAMSAIGVSSVHSDCSCTALASSRSGCRRINSTAAFVGFRGL